MDSNDCDDIHGLILEQGFEKAANQVLINQGTKFRARNETEGQQALSALLMSLLDADKTVEAALLLWGKEEFNPEPRSVQLIWNALETHENVLAIGGSGQGKSFTPCVYFLLWWVHDPAFTSIKVISVTSTHAAGNVMATLKSYHETAAIPLPGRRLDRQIDLGDGNRRAAIAHVNLPAGEDVKGRLRGFHPILRPKLHAKFGRKSRIAVVIDEGEDVSEGLWEGLENIRSSATKGTRHILVYAGANPKRRGSAFAQRCEPTGGWGEFDTEKSTEWEGPYHLGQYHVVRLDPAKSENILSKEEIFPGFQTYEGWQTYMAKGATHPDAMTFGRGAWPDEGSEYRITPLDYFREAYGELVFMEAPVNIGSFDPAFAEGGDDAVLTTGRYGKASGYYDLSRELVTFPAPKNAIQIEQQLLVPKANALVMADFIIRMLRALGIEPKNFIMDMTGNGLAIHDPLHFKFGDIMGQMWQDAATEKKILQEDSLNPTEQYRGVITEMAFAFSRWLELGHIKISALVGKKLERQATNRDYLFLSNGLRVIEDKSSYKSRNQNESPGEYDSAIMLVHLVRQRVEVVTAVPTQQRITPQSSMSSIIDEGTPYID